MTQNIPIVENILNANDKLAQTNRARLDAAGVFSINILASPGAGKTSVTALVSRFYDVQRGAVLSVVDRLACPHGCKALANFGLVEKLNKSLEDGLVDALVREI